MLDRIRSRSSIWGSLGLPRRVSTWVTYGLASIVTSSSIEWKSSRSYDPLAVNTAYVFQPPAVFFGWDGQRLAGYASRVISGTQLAVQSCAIILASASFFRNNHRLLSGYYGGWWMNCFMRISDVFIAFLAGSGDGHCGCLGPNLTNAMIAIAAVVVALLCAPSCAARCFFSRTGVYPGHTRPGWE